MDASSVCLVFQTKYFLQKKRDVLSSKLLNNKLFHFFSNAKLRKRNFLPLITV